MRDVMKIGVISDIHDHITNLEKAIDVLNKKKADLVIFCGDLSSPFVIEYFRDLKAPVKAVFGNNEGDRVNILEKIKNSKLNIEYAPKQGLMWDLRLEGKRLAVFHGHQQEMTDALVNSNLFDVVLTGHTHHFHIKKLKKTLWVNPGTLSGWAGLDFRTVKPTMATISLEALKTDIIHL
jgi:putative phosphoesterase